MGTGPVWRRGWKDKDLSLNGSGQGSKQNGAGVDTTIDRDMRAGKGGSRTRWVEAPAVPSPTMWSTSQEDMPFTFNVPEDGVWSIVADIHVVIQADWTEDLWFPVAPLTDARPIRICVVSMNGWQQNIPTTKRLIQPTFYQQPIIAALTTADDLNFLGHSCNISPFYSGSDDADVSVTGENVQLTGVRIGPLPG